MAVSQEPRVLVSILPRRLVAYFIDAVLFFFPMLLIPSLLFLTAVMTQLADPPGSAGNFPLVLMSIAIAQP